MTIPNSLLSLRRTLLRTTTQLAWLAPLLARVAVGLVFLTTGWGKLQHLDAVGQFFASLGLPAPGFMAALTAVTELVGGALLLVGLASRLAALALTVVMTVAIVTAKLASVDGVVSLVGLEEFTYIVVFVWIAVAGPGAASLDQVVGRSLDKAQQTTGGDR